MSGSWGPGSLLGNGGSPGPRERRGDRHPALRALRGTESGPPCKNDPGVSASGYYKATWTMAAAWSLAPAAQPVGRFGNFESRPPGRERKPGRPRDAARVRHAGVAGREELRVVLQGGRDAVERADERDAPGDRPATGRQTVLALAVAPVSETTFRGSGRHAVQPELCLPGDRHPGAYAVRPGELRSDITDSSQSAKVNAAATGSGSRCRTVDFPAGSAARAEQRRQARRRLARFRRSRLPPGGCRRRRADTPMASVALVGGTAPLNPDSDVGSSTHRARACR